MYNNEFVYVNRDGESINGKVEDSDVKIYKAFGNSDGHIQTGDTLLLYDDGILSDKLIVPQMSNYEKYYRFDDSQEWLFTHY